mmetsp:Transcript_59179/g.135743  ORF Transcript_59179/g.135743 Transcript_59179/m.135743 type:complete len:237 (+) Transcript_59179:383-1093(+)
MHSPLAENPNALAEMGTRADAGGLRGGGPVYLGVRGVEDEAVSDVRGHARLLARGVHDSDLAALAEDRRLVVLCHLPHHLRRAGGHPADPLLPHVDRGLPRHLALPQPLRRQPDLRRLLPACLWEGRPCCRRRRLGRRVLGAPAQEVGEEGRLGRRDGRREEAQARQVDRGPQGGARVAVWADQRAHHLRHWRHRLRQNGVLRRRERARLRSEARRPRVLFQVARAAGGRQRHRRR